MINKEGGIETMDLNKIKKRYRPLFFDMDGLMFDSERYVQKSWDIAGERLGYGPLGHNIVNTLGTNLTNRKKYFLEHYGNDFPFDKFLDGYRDAYYELVEDGVPAKKGLHEILKVLREKGLKIGVATSSSEEHAVSNLKREGIFDYFDSVITGKYDRTWKARARYLYRSMQTIKKLIHQKRSRRRCDQWNPFRIWSRYESSDDPRYRAGYKQSR